MRADITLINIRKAQLADAAELQRFDHVAATDEKPKWAADALVCPSLK